LTKDLEQLRVPRQVPGCDLRSLPLTPSEAYVLSRIDGMLSSRDLSSLTGLDPTDVDRTLDRLAELGAVTWDGLAERAPLSNGSRRQSAFVAQAVRGMQRPAVESYSQPPPPEPAEALALYDPSELDEDCELPPEKRRRILDAFYRLEDLTHYELLGVDPSSTKKQIKDAYYEIAAEYHPDRYFRKNLGSFKQKMEMVFSRVTQANDTLTRNQSRAEYDAYLETQKSTRQIERTLRDSTVELLRSKPKPKPKPADAPRQERTQVGRVAGPQQTQSQQMRAAWVAPPPPRDMIPPQEATKAPPKRSNTPSTKQSIKARREAFAARMSGGRVSRMPPARSSRPPETSSAPPDQAGEALRRHVVERKDAIRRAQLRKYTDAAQEALDRNDPAGAANAYQLALKLAPDDPALVQAHLDAQQSAAAMLAGGYLQQAQYEERAERWKEAARSYTRAADGMLDDAAVQAKAAETMLRADLDLRKAAEYAKRATGLEPQSAQFHMILGKIYLAAGLALNARREIELAAELAPSDATIARLLESIRKGART
jgi:curved DNA-binding protein CbpA